MFERYQSKGLAVGTLASHPSLKVFLDPTNLFGRHTAILGPNGSWQVMGGRNYSTKDGCGYAQSTHHYSGPAWRVLLET